MKRRRRRWFNLRRDADENLMRATLLWKAASMARDGVNDDYIRNYLRDREQEAITLRLLREPAHFQGGGD